MSHLYLNSDYCIDRHFCIVGYERCDAYARSRRGLCGKRGAFGVFALSRGETQAADTSAYAALMNVVFAFGFNTETGEKWTALPN